MILITKYHSRTPAMGYNTWNDFRCNGINAANVMAVANKMVELGLNKVWK